MVQGSLEATKPEITIGVLGQDVRSLLLAHGYSDDPIIHGSATAALNSLETGVFDLWTSKIRELLDTLDTTILAPQKIEDKPFLMSIEDVFSVPRTGTVVTGFVQRGTCRIGATVEVVGLGPTHATIATDLEQFHKKSYLLSPGNNAGVLLRGLNRADAQRGQFLAAPRTIKAYKRFRAVLYLPIQRENGSDVTELSVLNYAFSICSIEFNGTLKLKDGTDPVHEGKVIQIIGELEAAVAMETGLRFILRQNGRSIGFGVVMEPLS